MVCNNNADMLYTAFYGFQFPFIIYFFFWKSFIKYFCDEKDNNKQIITFCLISFLIGFSSEFFSFTTFCVLTLLFIGLTINYLFKKSKNISVYVYTYICSCMGFLLYVFNPGFIDTMSGKESNFFSFLDNFKDWFLEVIKSLKQTLFNDFIYIFLIIIILFIILFFLKIQNKRKKILILILYILSVIGFYLSMSFVRFGNDHLYICHFDVIMQVQIALIFAIILQISFLSEYKYLRNIIISIICCCLLYATKGNFVDVYKLIIKNDKDNYISRYSDNNIDTILNRYKSEYILLEDIKNGKEIYNLNKKELNPNNYLCHHYVETIYNLNYDINPQQLNIESVEQLYEKFLTEGGKVLPEEELNRHNFNVLLRKYKRNK
jgi:hypothetical protein